MPSDTTPPLPADSTRLYSAVDRSNETYEPSHHAPRRTIPSGRVSPDGTRNWPQPSLTSKIVIFGGMGIAAAAATAGAVLAVKAIVDAVAGDGDEDEIEAARQRARARSSGRASYKPRPSPAMGFADSRGSNDWDRRREDREREERRRREAARRRSAASAQQIGGGSVVDTVNETVSSVTHGVRDVLSTVTAAIEGFRSVAAQAGDVMADFNRAADQVKAMMEPAQKPRPAAGSQTRTAKADVVDLREGESQDARSHRL